MAGDTGSLVADALGEMVLHTGQFGDTIDRQEVAAVGDVSATSLFLVSLAVEVVVVVEVVVIGGGEVTMGVAVVGEEDSPDRSLKQMSFMMFN